VPVPGSWPNTDLKEYEAVIEILDDSARVRKLKPGMTAEVRIIVDDRKDNILQIPVQAVLSFSGRFYTYVVTKTGPERRELKVGDANDEHMEILDGVAIGESVVMSPRTHFSKELSALESENSAAAEKSRVKVETPERPAAGRPDAPASAEGAAGGRPSGSRDAAKSGPPAGGGTPGGFTMPADAKSMHEGMDKNKDGVITKEEHPYPQAFDRVDADGDGKITQEESDVAFKRMQSRAQ
jgi:hypothetical protein